MVDNDRRGTAVGSGLDVDMENLQAGGQSMVQSLIDNWPDKVPVIRKTHALTGANNGAVLVVG